MQRKRNYYLVKVQFLGFRYSGWQKQPGQKTIEGMLIKTLKYVLVDRVYKVLGAGRTDAKVSALEAAFELYLDGEPIEDLDEFLYLFNINLPQDIRILSVSKAEKKFNIIQHTKEKEYVYLFAYGEKSHPFCAPCLVTFLDDLDLEKMKFVAKMFEGTHNFKAYTVRANENKKLVRTIKSCEIRDNDIISASFFPEKTYALHVNGEGFMRYQIRMLMGVLVEVGKGNLSISDIEESLKLDFDTQLPYVAPGSGLLLNKLKFK